MSPGWLETPVNAVWLFSLRRSYHFRPRGVPIHLHLLGILQRPVEPLALISRFNELENCPSALVCLCVQIEHYQSLSNWDNRTALQKHFMTSGD